MLAFAIRRLIEATFVMLTVALLSFVLFRFVGDPVNQIVSQDATLEDRIKLRADLGELLAARSGSVEELWSAYELLRASEAGARTSSASRDECPAPARLPVAGPKS